MIDHTKQIVFAGRVVAFAGPANEARDAHGRWEAAISSLPHDYDHDEIRRAAGILPAKDIGTSKRYVQWKLGQNKRVADSEMTWGWGERDLADEKKRKSHNALLQDILDHGAASGVK